MPRRVVRAAAVAAKVSKSASTVAKAAETATKVEKSIVSVAKAIDKTDSAMSTAESVGNAVEAIQNGDYRGTVLAGTAAAAGGSGIKSQAVKKGAKKKLPPQNYGKSKPHGNPDHDQAINDRINELKKQGAEDIRKNQKQVDIDGYIVGNNRPDLQYKMNNEHHVEEFDRTQKSSDAHLKRIKENDPNSITKVNLI